MDNEHTELMAWLEEKRTLAEICEKFPEEWEAAKIELGGQVKLNRLNEYLVRKLLFSKGDERKPASMFWFHLLWPFIS